MKIQSCISYMLEKTKRLAEDNMEGQIELQKNPIELDFN